MRKKKKNFDPMDSVCFAHSVHGLECAREVWAEWRALSFLIQKEPATVLVGETCSSFFNADIRTLFSADVLEKCALLALHEIAEEGRDGAGYHVPGSEDENASCSGPRDGKVCNDALHVIGLYGPGDEITLFLQGWELAKGGLELSHGPGHAVPGTEWAW